jgi:hypothetical protein
METTTNLELEDVIRLTQEFNIQPMFNYVIITLNKQEEDGVNILSDNIMSDVQYVIAKGDMVRNIEVTDKVLLNLEKLMIKETNPHNQYESFNRIKIEPIEFGGYMFGMIEDRIIKAKYVNQ